MYVEIVKLDKLILISKEDKIIMIKNKSYWELRFCLNQPLIKLAIQDWIKIRTEKMFKTCQICL